MSSIGHYTTRLNTGVADSGEIRDWLVLNEHQSLDLLLFTLRGFGYSKERLFAAFILYVESHYEVTPDFLPS